MPESEPGRSNGNSNSNSNSNTSSHSHSKLVKPSSSSSSKSEFERPPLLKRSRTISDGTRTATPHFPGPLFPAVRRVSTISSSTPSLLRPSDLRVSVDDSDPPSSSSSSASSSLSHHGDFSDRDWVYPSFVVPHASKRGHVNKLALSDSRGRGGVRTAAMGGGGGGGGAKLLDNNSQRITTAPASAAPRRAVSNEGPQGPSTRTSLSSTSTSTATATATSSELTRSSSARKTRQLKPSVVLFLVSHSLFSTKFALIIHHVHIHPYIAVIAFCVYAVRHF